jgi:hypothetical protein
LKENDKGKAEKDGRQETYGVHPCVIGIHERESCPCDGQRIIRNKAQRTDQCNYDKKDRIASAFDTRHEITFSSLRARWRTLLTMMAVVFQTG